MYNKRITFLVLFLVAIFFALLYFDKQNAYMQHNENSKEKDVYKVGQMIDKLVVMDNTKKHEVANAIVNYGSYYDISYEDIIAIAYTESRFNAKAINTRSRVGKDIGICQINTYYHKKRYTDEKHLLDADNNIRIACEIIDEIRSMGKNDIAYYHTLSKNKNFYKYKKKCDNVICMVRR